MARLSAVLAILLLAAGTVSAQGVSRGPRKEMRDGRLFIDGKWVFLKTAKALRNFAHGPSCDQLAADLPVLKKKGYNCVELDCYWHLFDNDGDGVPDVSLEPFAKLIDEIYRQGMFPCVSAEVYGVGGGKVPDGFWKSHPDAEAISAEGKPVRDTEYGFDTRVPSIFSPAYRNATRTFMFQLARGVPYQKILYFETTVEPQYMGKEWLDYSEHARRAYEKWLRKKRIKGPEWPEKFPVPESFRKDPVWNRFRAESLADWVDGDAAAYRKAAGRTAWIAVDYLESGGDEMMRRNGDSLVFLRSLKSADILQVNWHWNLRTRAPNTVAYENVGTVMKEEKRSWAVTEHMTLNGSDFKPEEALPILRAALKNGTGFGWGFVNVAPSTKDEFSLYNDDWSPKPLMAEVDNRWPELLKEAHASRDPRGR